jgi:alkanesulfonate monooxygenase SsuD/methylene tetrahydromethanopterin reductase-like flavin-dependent oxidoreductase (luciferase family)
VPDEIVDAISLVGSEDEVAERVERFRSAGIDRLIVSPVHVDREQQIQTLERLAVLTGVGTPA